MRSLTRTSQGGLQGCGGEIVVVLHEVWVWNCFGAMMDNWRNWSWDPNVLVLVFLVFFSTSTSILYQMSINTRGFSYM